MASQNFWVLAGRGLRQRCPVCGKGKIFSNQGKFLGRLFNTYERCPVCHFVFEREPGYYTGAVALNLVLTELLITAIGVPVAASQAVSIPVMVAMGVTLPVLLPVIFYRPTKSLWMCTDHLLHPADE
jgi:uncharacterized protein (DUF983 family)